MKRIPVIPTLIVALAVVTMIGLGFWQLQRREAKQALLASYAANADLPVMALPHPPIPDSLLFRRMSATCIQPGEIMRVAGRTADGRSGYRLIAACASGAEGPGFRVELGVAGDPAFQPQWAGGPVTGLYTHAPDGASLFDRLIGRAPPPTPMLVPEAPLAPGLAPSNRPDPSRIPDNHLAYAVQWFAFALVALAIYVLALRRRNAGARIDRAQP